MTPHRIPASQVAHQPLSQGLAAGLRVGSQGLGWLVCFGLSAWYLDLPGRVFPGPQLSVLMGTLAGRDLPLVSISFARLGLVYIY